MVSKNLPERKSPLVISAEAERSLSPEQQLFNKRCREMDALTAELEEEPARLQRLYALFLKELKPSLQETGLVYVELAETMQQKIERLKSSKSQNFLAETFIRKLLQEAENNGANIEHHALSIIYRQENFGGTRESRDGGFKVGDIEIDEQSAIRDPQSEIEDSSQWFKAPKRRLSKAEKQQKQFEVSKQKQLKRMYLTLAKLLHPDTEPDPVLAAEKQEYMKLVTQAYQANDLAGLLRLELAFVHKEAAHVNRLTEDRLAMYNSFLAEQITTLKNRLEEMRGNPAFYEIGAVLDLPTGQAEKRIRQAARGVKEALFHLDLLRTDLMQAVTVKEALACLDGLYPEG